MTVYAGKAGAVVRKFSFDKSDLAPYYFRDEESGLGFLILGQFSEPKEDKSSFPEEGFCMPEVQDVRCYQETGYVIARGLFGAEEVQSYREYFMQMRAAGTYLGDFASVD